MIPTGQVVKDIRPRVAIYYGFLKANHPDELADQRSNPILMGA